MRALWSDRQNCSHNVSQKVKRIRRLSEPGGHKPVCVCDPRDEKAKSRCGSIPPRPFTDELEWVCADPCQGRIWWSYSTPDPNTSAKVWRYKWEPYHDRNWCCDATSSQVLKRGGDTFCKSAAIEMGGVSRNFSQVWGSGVDI